MKTTVILASGLFNFQRQLRINKGMLIRAIPFTNAENVECYRMMYVEYS